MDVWWLVQNVWSFRDLIFGDLSSTSRLLTDHNHWSHGGRFGKGCFPCNAGRISLHSQPAGFCEHIKSVFQRKLVSWKMSWFDKHRMNIPVAQRGK